MNAITFYGASDDLIEIDGEADGADEYNDTECDKRPHRFELVAPDGASMLVYAFYDGCWFFAPAMRDEGGWPGWDVQVREQPRDGGDAYSTLLTIDAPEGTRVVDLMPRED